jgi:UDP-N-acetylglucosamine 2-epimerase (non-hydrolysing)
MRIICVVGARPNFMKIKPVMDALAWRGQDVVLVHTGQHYDPAMSEVFFNDLGLRRPDHFLGAGSGTHATQTARVMLAFEPVVASVRPDVVIVVGDVNSTLACSLVTAKSEARLGHVEAGLRSGDWTMPEEVNRVVTDRVSDYLFAPSQDAIANLRSEGRDDAHLVGNVMVDTLLANLEQARERDTLARLGLKPGGYGLVTLHRAGNVDDPVVLDRLLSALDEVSAMCPLVLPAHPRLANRIAQTSQISEASQAGRMRIIPPAGYLDFIALQASALLVLTDSGGVQEETTALGIPCLTLRENTERPITLTHGTNQLVGTDPGQIVAAAKLALASPGLPRRPALWDGHAGERIAAMLLDGEAEAGRPAGAVPQARSGEVAGPVII